MPLVPVTGEKQHRWRAVSGSWQCLVWAWQQTSIRQLFLFHSLVMVRPPNEYFRRGGFQTVLMQSVAEVCL